MQPASRPARLGQLPSIMTETTTVSAWGCMHRDCLLLQAGHLWPGGLVYWHQDSELDWGIVRVVTAKP